MNMTHDVVIVGGGPAGSTAGALLRQYNPDLRVLIVERERFPRDHVGESQLPVIGWILNEMGCWDKVEAADFPIKIGATYRWGATQDLWNFEFIPDGVLEDAPRPARYEGKRTQTAFQVDRAIYDKILLDHARERGCEVWESARVLGVEKEGDRILSLDVEDETGARQTVRGTYYVDASGGSGALRRAMGVEVVSPTSLRNIAIWDYWQNADWAVEIGAGGTRIQVLSLDWGWIWFIPLGPTRTSVGLVLPTSYLKQTGERPAELYARALSEEPRVARLLTHATSEGNLQTTNDWSYVANRLTGENWFLAGDSCGFADPILSAGMTLAQSGAREVAYSILDLFAGTNDPAWLKEAYDVNQRKRIGQHIRFADYWYSANERFTELKEYTSQIAKDAGLDLNADEAFQWLGTGGFANDGSGKASIGTFSLAAVKQMALIMTDREQVWNVNKYNVFRLRLDGAEESWQAAYENGAIRRERMYRRGDKTLLLSGAFRLAYTALTRSSDLLTILNDLKANAPQIPGLHPNTVVHYSLHALEAMLIEGWVVGSVDPSRPTGSVLKTRKENQLIYFEREPEPALAREAD